MCVMHNMKPSARHIARLLDRNSLLETALPGLERPHVMLASEIALKGGIFEIANSVRPHAEGVIINALATWLVCVLGLVEVKKVIDV